MKRLFTVVDRSTGKPLSSGPNAVMYFDSKIAAKATRDEFNPPKKEDHVMGTAQQYAVSIGPDHRGYNE